MRNILEKYTNIIKIIFKYITFQILIFKMQ